MRNEVNGIKLINEIKLVMVIKVRSMFVVDCILCFFVISVMISEFFIMLMVFSVKQLNKSVRFFFVEDFVLKELFVLFIVDLFENMFVL